MNKPNKAWMISASFLLLTACSKQEPDIKQPQTTEAKPAEHSRLDQLKLYAIKQMYAETQKVESGNDTLPRYSTDRFKSILEMTKQFPGEICGYNSDVIMMSQAPDYTKMNFSYSLNQQGQVIANLGRESIVYELVCSANSCLVDDVIFPEYGNRLSSDIQKECGELAQYHQEQQAAQEQPHYQFSYHIESQNMSFGNQSTTIYTLVISSESDNPVELNKISVNRGNCPVHIIGDQNNILQFGQNFKLRLHCDGVDVKEVRLLVDKDKEFVMKSRY
ncbi:hypothetical protein [Acinetobacter sp. WCHA45]|uniref:hypothetical protein n=1 Tax=Acinetobacter sp. WCHA45 TaxID=2004644 RepID=UPI000B3CD658|nr:hypothetical protein [Acinetobacter sp. WCHA45]AVZ84653.1 hypothetical protein CDG55_02065 [Acinetobacter sp. WCHA45]AVZ85154.1 hypothetical protein CDG55_04895 [Acinetobacter sp. WCHA45]